MTGSFDRTLLRGLIQLVRPRHWIKNAVVFIPVIFGRRMNDIEAWTLAGSTAIAFCLASAISYIVNDIKDCNSDLAHPLKRSRPLASGAVSIKAAGIEAGVFLVILAAMAPVLPVIVLVMIGIFLVLQISYTMFLKHLALIDVICIALGFVLRAGSGVAAIKGEVSPWLFICMFTICLFMGFCKRYNEVVTIEDSEAARNHRPTLIEYTPELLTHLITLSAGIAVISFLLYGLSESTIHRFGSNYFVYTLPVVVYGVFRFAMLSMKGSYADPMGIFLNDRPFQITVIIWIAAALVIILYGRSLGGWLQSLY